MTSAKLYLLAALLTGASVLLGAGVGGYVAVKGVERRLGLEDGAVGRAAAALADLEGVLHDIRGDEEGEFGRRMAELRRRHPFAPPADRRLSDRQVRQFLAVRGRLAAVDQEMAADMARDGGGEPSVGNLVEWNFFSRVHRLRGVQATALEEQGMPFEEYLWVYGEIYKALLSEGMTPGDRTADWSAAVREGFASSTAAVERELADPATPPERRQQLEVLRAELGQREQLLTGLAGGAQQALAEVPPENVALVERHAEEIARVMLAAVDLDTVDFFATLEGVSAGAGR